MNKVRNNFFAVVFALSVGFLDVSVAQEASEIKSVKISALMEELRKDDDTTRIVNLWATWCAPCVKELPHFEEVNQTYADKKVKIFLVAVEDIKEKVSSFVHKKDLKTAVLFLDETDANFWIPQIDEDWQGEIPVTLAVNNALDARLFHSGSLDREELIALIEKSSN